MMTPATPQPSVPRVLWRTVATDRLVQAALVVLAAVTAIYLAGHPDAPTLLPLSTIVLLVLAVAALVRGLPAIPSLAERRFWSQLAVAYGFWLVSAVILASIVEESLAVGLVSELGYGLYYMVLAQAVEHRPHLPLAPAPAGTRLLFRWPAVGIFVFGMVIYFVLIPAVANPTIYGTLIPSYSLYMVLDGYLAVRLLFLARTARSHRWRILYTLLCLAVASSFLPAAAGLAFRSSDAFPSLASELLWKLTVVLVVLTARLRHRLPPAEAEGMNDERRDAASEARGQTLFLTLLFPFVHFASYATGLLDLPSKPLREAMVAVWLILIGAVAFLQYRILARTRRELREGNVSLSEELAWRRQAQEEKERLIAELEDKHAEMERFTYTVSHDLKSPLFTIQGFVGLLERDAAAGNREQMEEDLRRIRSAAGKMQQLLDELLELSRIGRIANVPEPTPLGELAEEAVELVAARIAERSVEVVIEPDLPTVVADRRRLFEVFQNLIENAVKFMGDQPRPRIEIGARKEGGETVCWVRDNGRGIEPAYLEKVFGLFERLEQGGEGTGIGLAIVERVIELHGGRVWVDSEGAGRGATFCFTLPAGDAG